VKELAVQCVMQVSMFASSGLWRAVLRQCDEACVRELAVQCVMQVRMFHCLHLLGLACCELC
jgi:hypothetical protein